jgi:hypothetical protein
MQTQSELWLNVCDGRYPDLDQDRVLLLGMQAAGEFWRGMDTSLACLYSQYLMLRKLQDV